MTATDPRRLVDGLDDALHGWAAAAREHLPPAGFCAEPHPWDPTALCARLDGHGGVHARDGSDPWPVVPPMVGTREVIAALGVSFRQLDVWCRRGLLRPVHAGGSGTARRFPPDEVAVAAAMARLVRAGLTPSAAVRVARGGPLGPGLTLTIDPTGAP